MKYFVVLVFLFGTSAQAIEGTDSWERADVLKVTLYSKSISDTVYTPGEDSDLPNIQEIRQPLAKNTSEQMNQLLAKIFTSLGFNADVKQPTLTDMGIKAGTTGKLSGHMYERTGYEGRDKFVYCAALIRDRQKVHAIYFKSFADINPSCSKGITSLARSKVLYQ